MRRYRGVLVGAGGFAGVWARQFLPEFRDRVGMVGIADINPTALTDAADALDIPESARFASFERMFAVNDTIETAGGAFRHQFPDAMIYEGAEHHIDQFRNLLDADGEWVQGAQWNQPWSTFPENNTCVSLLAGMSNGTMVQYEMNHIDRGHQNGWHSEYYRIACEGGTVVLDADHVTRVTRHVPGQPETVEEIMPDTDPRDGHLAVIGTFLDWLDGGPAPVTVMDDNLKTMALTFGAVEATRTGRRVSVAPLLDGADVTARNTTDTVPTFTMDNEGG